MDLTLFIRYLHSGWRYLVILVLVLAVVDMLWGLLARRAWTQWDRRIGSLASIVISIQWAIGIVFWILLFVPIMGSLSPSMPGVIEHPVTMTLGLALLHIFWGRAKKAETDQLRFRLATLAFALSGAVIWLGIWRMTG